MLQFQFSAPNYVAIEAWGMFIGYSLIISGNLIIVLYQYVRVLNRNWTRLQLLKAILASGCINLISFVVMTITESFSPEIWIDSADIIIVLFSWLLTTYFLSVVLRQEYDDIWNMPYTKTKIEKYKNDLEQNYLNTGKAFKHDELQLEAEKKFIRFNAAILSIIIAIAIVGTMIFFFPFELF